MTNRMTAFDRKILRALKACSFLGYDNQALAGFLGVSVEQVEKDLKSLAEKGMVRRAVCRKETLNEN